MSAYLLHFRSILVLVLLISTASGSEPAPGQTQDMAQNPEPLCAPIVATTASEHQAWQQAQLPVGEIRVESRPIFNEADPQENNWAFRWVNRLHVDTDTEVIADDLLLKADKPFDAAAMAESERILRKRKYLRAASISAEKNCAGKIDLTVQTQDVWTLIPEFGYSHKGDTTTSRVGVKDNNFLGSGKTVSLKRENDVDRTSTELGYNDPNWGAHRGALSLAYADTSDGEYYDINLARPFYALETPWSASVALHQATQVDHLFLAGEEIQSFEHEEQAYGLHYGVARGLHDNQAVRWLLGYNVVRDQFTATDETVAEIALPDNRHYSYPWLGWEWQQNEFIKANNINQINLVEDINLGWFINAKLGYSSNFIEPAQDALVFAGQAERSWRLADDKIMEFSSELKGYYQDHRLRNSVVELRTRYHHNVSARHQVFGQIHAFYGTNLFVDMPLYLGGDDGLRGYPLRYQGGERSAIFTMEHRWFTPYEFLKLFDVGAATFYDAGHAWHHTNGSDDDGRWLQAAGLGLRLSPTRIGSTRRGHHNVIHIDLAFPFEHNEDVDSWQFSVQVKDSF